MNESQKSLLHKFGNRLGALIGQIDLLKFGDVEFNQARLDKMEKIGAELISTYQTLCDELSEKQPQQLHYLCYVSEHSMSAEHLTTQIEAILAKSRTFNRALHISGLLLTRGKYFVQYLEGTREALEQVYGRIAMDGRHQNIHLVGRGSITERQFAGWDMAYYPSLQVEDKALVLAIESYRSRQDLTWPDLQDLLLQFRTKLTVR